MLHAAPILEWGRARPVLSKRVGNAGPLNGVHILLVDDERDSRALLTAIFSSVGASVTSVDRADAALQALTRGAGPSFDLAVVDIRLPDMPGYELLREIRSQRHGHGRLPAIAVTGFDSPAIRNAIREVAFDAYLLKPIDRAGLIRAAIRALQNKPEAEPPDN